MNYIMFYLLSPTPFYSINSNAIGGGLCDFKIDGDTLTEGDSESGLSFNLTKPIGRPLHQVKSASSTDLLQSGTSSCKIGIWDDLLSETNEKVATPTSEFLDANTRWCLQLQQLSLYIYISSNTNLLLLF